MSKIMEMVDLKNKVHRDGFDLSCRVSFTGKVGEILPIDFIPCIPGDYHKLANHVFTRTSPLQTASSARLREYTDWYFVPYRLLWRHFNDWVLQGNNSVIASSWKSAFTNVETCPHTTLRNLYRVLGTSAFRESTDVNVTDGYTRGQGASKLLEYLGLPLVPSDQNDPVLDKAINLWPLLAYQKVYQDYFRFAQWEDVAPWTYNVDYLNVGSDMDLYVQNNNYSGITSMFDLRFCNYDKDYFHGIMPTPQFGDDTAMASPIIGNVAGDITLGVSEYSATGNPTAQLVINKDNNFVQYLGDSSFNGEKNPKVYGNMSLGANTNAGISVLAIRYAEMYQKFKEITLSSSDRSVKSLLEKHWNVKVSDYFSDMCVHVCGSSQNITINQVINQNLADSASQADIHGFGINESNGSGDFTAKEYGILINIYHAKPVIEWETNDVFMSHYLNVGAADYPIPEFDNLGMEPVYKYEFLRQYTNPTLNLNTVAGYGPRYFRYKTNFDKVKGGFVRTLKSWVLPFTQSGDEVNYLTFKVSPSITDNLFAVKASGDIDTDHLQVIVDQKINSVRNLSRDGMPY